MLRRRCTGWRALWGLLPAVAGAVAVAAPAGPPAAAPAASAQVRAITAFVDLDPARYAEQFRQVAASLRQAQALFAQDGFTVQTLRVTTQPFMKYVRGLDSAHALTLLDRLEDLGRQNNLLVNIGPAVLDDHPDPLALEILEQAQGRGRQLSASMIVADEDGVHWNAVRAAAHHVWRIAAMSREGTFSFAATAMLAPGAPFYPGSWHDGQGGRFSVGLQSASVVAQVLAASHGDASRATEELAQALSGYAERIGRVATRVEDATGLKYWGFDPTPAPRKEDSIGAALEGFQPATLGSPGTLTAAWVITEALHQVSGARVGFSGLMLPVMEDARVAQRWSEGVISLDSLLAYSAVCGTGLDTVPLPGDVTEAQLARIIGDVAVLAYKWKKPLTARLQPAHGRRAGETSNFDDPALMNTRLQPLR
jgi:uncharacterized protein (UPF0210 family)